MQTFIIYMIFMGMLWEWVYDVYREKLEGGRDPVNEGSGFRRVLRGGSWGYSAQSLRSAFRLISYPGSRGHDFGFRLVRNL